MTHVNLFHDETISKGEKLGLCGCFEQYKCGALRIVIVHLIGLLAYGIESQYGKVRPNR
jgi:hypothetical protein